MKKLLVSLIVLLLILLVVWAGASWFIGGQTEKFVRQRFEESATGVGAAGFKQELVSYERSLFGAKAITRVQVDNAVLNKWFNQVQLVHDIQNGPILWDGLPKLGVSQWKSHVDRDSLDANTRDALDVAFNSQPPLEAVTRIGFDRQLHYQVEINPLDVQSDESGGSLKLEGLQAQGSFDPAAKTGTLQAHAGAASWRDQDMTLSAPEVEIGSLPPAAEGKGGVSLKVTDLTVLVAGETEPLKLDVNFQGDTRQQNGDVDGEGSLQASNIRGGKAGVRGLDWQLAFKGLNTEGLVQLQQLQSRMQTLQAQVDLNEENSELPEGQQKTMQLGEEVQAVSGQLLDTLLNRILHADKSRVHSDIKLALDKGAVDGKVDLGYAGNGSPIAVSDLLAYGPQDWGRLLRGSIEMQVDKTAVGDDMAMLLAFPLQQQGITQQGGRYNLKLNLMGDKAELNGKMVSYAELPGRFFPQMPVLDDKIKLGIPPDIMQQIETHGMNDEIMQQLDESDDVTPETKGLLRQLNEMSKALK